MKGFTALSLAMLKGFYRDKMTMFFTVLFPLFFIVIFGTIFANPGTSQKTVILVGDVPFISSLPPDARSGLDEIFTFGDPLPLDQALEEVKTGDASAAIEQQGDQIILHISRADAIGAATVEGVLSSFVDNTNLSVAGVTPKYQLQSEQVEDQSLKGVQYVAPGMIAYGITVGATFGAAMTLVTWRSTKVLRRLRLAPVSTVSVVAARVVVSMLVAMGQLVIFIGVASLPFLGLQLSGAWYMAVPLVIAGTLAFLAIGLFVGAIAKTPEGGAGLANLITLPMGFLSGAFIPLDQAPGWLAGIAKVMPMGYLVSGLQDVLVRGQGPGSALLPIGILLAFAAVVTVIATRFFKWDSA